MVYSESAYTHTYISTIQMEESFTMLQKRYEKTNEMEERDQQVQASNFSLNEQDGNCVKDKCPLIFSCRVELITNLPKRIHFDTALHNRFKAYCIFEQRGSNIGNQRSTNIFFKKRVRKKHILCKNKRRRNFFYLDSASIS